MQKYYFHAVFFVIKCNFDSSEITRNFDIKPICSKTIEIIKK